MTLFDVEPVVPAKPRKVNTAPKWTTNTTRATCYDCITELADGKFINARRANWRRTQGETVALYCYAHAIPRRDADAASVAA